MAPLEAQTKVKGIIGRLSAHQITLAGKRIAKTMFAMLNGTENEEWLRNEELTQVWRTQPGILEQPRGVSLPGKGFPCPCWFSLMLAPLPLQNLAKAMISGLHELCSRRHTPSYRSVFSACGPRGLLCPHRTRGAGQTPRFLGSTSDLPQWVLCEGLRRGCF